MNEGLEVGIKEFQKQITNFNNDFRIAKEDFLVRIYLQLLDFSFSPLFTKKMILLFIMTLSRFS